MTISKRARPFVLEILDQSMGARNRVGIGLLYRLPRARICSRLWSPGINFEESIPPAYVAWRAGTKNRVVVPVRQAGNRFLGSINGLQIRAQDSYVGGVDSLESIPGLLKSLKIPSLLFNYRYYFLSTNN